RPCIGSGPRASSRRHLLWARSWLLPACVQEALWSKPWTTHESGPQDPPGEIVLGHLASAGHPDRPAPPTPPGPVANAPANASGLAHPLPPVLPAAVDPAGRPGPIRHATAATPTAPATRSDPADRLPAGP